MTDTVEKILAGDVRAAARLIRDIDDGEPGAIEFLKRLFPHTGRAYVMGITGSPGVGKSTLTDRLVRHLRTRNLTVGVLAVDPTSPFTGGAILGDRVRMQGHSTDDGVFIRSMATRGQFGGLTRSTRGAVMVLDAMGKDVVIVETVGVGQDEVDIARMAETTVIVLSPGLGDDIQAIKAGILEVGDIFAINKADNEGADKTAQEIRSMLEMEQSAGLGRKDWSPPVLKTSARNNEGIEELWAAAERHRSFLAAGNSAYYRELGRMKARLELVDLVKQRAADEVMAKLHGRGGLERLVDELLERRTDPYTISERILDEVFERKERLDQERD